MSSPYPPPPPSSHPYPPPGSTLPSDYEYASKSPHAHFNSGNQPPYPYPPAPHYGGAPPNQNYYPPPPSDPKYNFPPSYQMGPSPAGPAPLSEQHRFAPPKGFQDLWAALLFLAHLILVAVIAGLTFPSLNLNLFNNISNGNSVRFSGQEITALAVGAGGSIVISLCYLFAMRAFPRALILFTFWGSILFYCVVGVGAAIVKLWPVAIGSLITAVIYIVFWFVYRKRVPFAAVMLRAVSSITLKYPGTIWCGFMSLLFGVAYIALWALVLLASVQKYNPEALDPSRGNARTSLNVIVIVIYLYMLFSLYWTSQVIKNVVHVTDSGVFAAFYFLKGTPQGMPSFPTFSSFKRAITTSFGSICFGSLLIAVIAFIRALLREAMNNSNNGACIFLACCVECLLSYIEALANLFNVYAFTQVAIYGKDFCRAAKDTWTLVQDRGLELIINNNLIGTVLAFGGLLVGGVTALLTFVVWRVYNVQQDLTTAAAPLTIAIIASLLIGLVIFALIAEVIQSGAATTFVCLAEDPAALKASKPELWEEIHKTYPEAAFSNMYT